MPAKKYTLHYFEVRGLGEAIRLLLTYAKVPFEDKRYSRNDWPKEKFAFGRLPVLELSDGRQLAESFAILQYLAREHGLAGGDEVTQAEVSARAYLYQDFLKETMPYLMIVFKFREGDKDKSYKEVFKPAMEKYGPLLERVLKEAGNGYFSKAGITWVDFYTATFTKSGHNAAPEDFDKYPALMAHSDRIHALPQLKSYIASRPDSQV